MGRDHKQVPALQGGGQLGRTEQGMAAHPIGDAQGLQAGPQERAIRFAGQLQLYGPALQHQPLHHHKQQVDLLAGIAIATRKAEPPGLAPLMSRVKQLGIAGAIEHPIHGPAADRRQGPARDLADREDVPLGGAQHLPLQPPQHRRIDAAIE